MNQPVSSFVSPNFTSANDLVRVLKSIVGKRFVISGVEKTRRYRKGFRFGEGKALAVVRPGTLVEQWRVINACLAANTAMIMQAANTGLTGGSTPFGDDYDREVVVINTMRINKIQVINNGAQVICLPGATLDQLEKALKPYGREPHSVIGSSCIGASVLGGVCNNSGGSLVKRGPVYTELAIYAQVCADGKLALVNHLGIALTGSPEEVLQKLENRAYSDSDISAYGGRASDDRYAEHVRDINADTPARFNADPLRLHEASGSAGKLSVFGVRLDTFPAEVGAEVLYVGTNSTYELAQLRREILKDLPELPIAGEYMHRDAYDISKVYGKDTFVAIDVLGTQRIPQFFAFKNWVDGWARRLKFIPENIADLSLQFISRLLPNHLPKRMEVFRDRYEHHLLLKVSGGSYTDAMRLLEDHCKKFPGSAFFQCTKEEGRKAFLHRFAAAGAAVRYRSVHSQQVGDIVALDIALRRNDTDWFESLPEQIESRLVKKLYYGHFLCHVMHQDYLIKKGESWIELEHEMLVLLDERGAQYPAEHNVGHLYKAPPVLANFYQKLDPCNHFNPGVGQTSKCSHWQ
jgi:D-lactate dehydrogenase (quinone)